MELRSYFAVGLSLGFAALFFGAFRFLSDLLQAQAQALGRWRRDVQLGYFFLLSAIGCSLFWVQTNLKPFKPPVSQVRMAEWGAQLRSSQLRPLGMVSSAEDLYSDGLFSQWVECGKSVIGYGIGLVIFILGVRIFYLTWKFYFSFEGHRIRKIGRVEVFASEGTTAFSTWLPWRALVVVPISVFSSSNQMRAVISHELQHHRQRDTLWLFVLEGLRILYFWNPLLLRMLKNLAQFQEFACDEALISRRKISPQAYTRCLLEAAESAIVSRLAGTGTVSSFPGPVPFTAKNDLTLLKRRVQMITRYQKSAQRSFGFFHATLAAICLGSLSLASFAASSSLPGGKLTLDEARQFADRATERLKASGHTAIPIEMNGLVLEKLNQLTRTSAGKKWMKDGLERMRQYEGMILSQMNSHAVPEELIAIPLFESGFKNLPPTPPQKGAGIWEFIASTAKRYRLDVSGEKDDRLNAVEETRAAMEYLNDLNKEFKDWRLVVKAYNEGEASVRELIAKHSTRDPWLLESQKSPEGYLSGVMAVIILLKNPELLG